LEQGTPLSDRELPVGRRQDVKAYVRSASVAVCADSFFNASDAAVGDDCIH
jgi:hypothetical protein